MSFVSRRTRVRTATAAAVIIALGLTAPQVSASGVSDQRREVERIADQLDAIADRIGQLDEDYGAAQDRKDALDIEIADLSAKVAAQQGELAELQAKLTDIALDRFTSSGSGQLSPLLSTAEAYTDSQQKAAIAEVALDTGTVDADGIAAQVTELEKQQQQLADKQAEAAQLIVYLDAKKAEADQLETQYQQQYADAQARLGSLIQQEQERRAAQAAAAQAAAWQAANGGGNNGGGGNGGGNEPIRGGGNGPAAAPAPTPSEPVSAPPVSGRAGTAVSAAYGQLGVPYRFAASSPGVAFDCSGLTKYAWAQAGVSLPHQSRAQFAATPRVPTDQAQPGDLIFYYSPIGHVAIYIGGGQLIHAPRTGDVVKIAAVNWGKVVGVTRPG
jgi:cell wall-associated NlpC family hydrolase